MRQQRRSKADGAEQIGGDDGLGVRKIGLLLEKVLAAHDAGVVDEDVEGGELSDNLPGKCTDGGAVFDIELERLDARVGGGGFGESAEAAAGDDDLVAESVEGLSEAAANARAAASDEDRVAGGIHESCCL